jgi:hypothetical protein
VAEEAELATGLEVWVAAEMALAVAEEAVVSG